MTFELDRIEVSELEITRNRYRYRFGIVSVIDHDFVDVYWLGS